jgi:outer membrane protein OmpA-like peptidoglycan-associated protein
VAPLPLPIEEGAYGSKKRPTGHRAGKWDVGPFDTGIWHRRCDLLLLMNCVADSHLSFGRRRQATVVVALKAWWGDVQGEGLMAVGARKRNHDASGKEKHMTRRDHATFNTNVAITVVGLLGAALLGGCAGQAETMTMQQAGGPPQQVIVPKGAFTGAASGAQADALAQEIVKANNNTMKQFDAENGRLDKIQVTENKDYQTAQQTLAKLEQLSNEQGTGQITLFFKTGSIEMDSFQNQRLVNFLDYLARESRGRTVILVSIGSASAVGNAELNKKLSTERSEATLPMINQYLVNVPHKFYKVTGVGDMYAPKNAPLQVENRYQSARVIATYSTSDLSAVSAR